MTPRVVAFRQRLDEIDFVEGRNVTIWGALGRASTQSVAGAGGRSGRPPRRGDRHHERPRDRRSQGNHVHHTDRPPERGKNKLVAGLERPSGNITGLSWFGVDLAPARLSLLHQLAPKVVVVGPLVGLESGGRRRAAAGGAGRRGRGWAQARRAACRQRKRDIDAAFAKLVALRVGALVVGATAFFTGRREQLIELAVRHAIPAIYATRWCLN
jgi:hypothetical protein